MKQVHDSKKTRYDKLEMKLASERQHLERECEHLQAEWLQSERNYHYLSNVNEIAKINIEKVRLEEDWRNGTEKMLPDFKCLHDLYEHKLIQQENLAKQLRIEQRVIKENEPENVKQVSVIFPNVSCIVGVQLNLTIDTNVNVLCSASHVFAVTKAHAAQNEAKNGRGRRTKFVGRQRLNEWPNHRAFHGGLLLSHPLSRRLYQ